MATWRELIKEAIGGKGDLLIGNTLSESEMDVEFDNGYGGSEGIPFTAWSKDRVYFPVVYDGAEWVSSVPRNPCAEASDHCGGG